MAKAAALLEKAEIRRDLARRARRLAEKLSTDDRERLRAHAEELEGEATELEGLAANMAEDMTPTPILSTAIPQMQVQQQQQQQQQADTEPKADVTDPKSES